MGKPSAKAGEEFTLHNLEGINIWKADNVSPEEAGVPIEIGLEKMLFFYRLTVDKAKKIAANKPS